jgi:methionyl-tRNA synthetase
MIVSATEEIKTPSKPLVSYDDFSKIDLRVATILKAETVPNTKKLLKLQVQTGKEERTLVAGIAESYTPEDLIGAQVVIVANLQPAKIKGIESQGMILAAQSGEKLIIIRPEKTTGSGSKVA